MDIKENILSRKYAQAFINLFGDNLGLEDLEKLKELIKFFNNRSDITFYLSLVVLSNNTKKEQLINILKESKLSEKFNNLIELLIEHNRISIFPMVIFYIRELLKQKLNISEFKIKTSHKISKEFINKLLSFFSSKINKEVHYSTELDKNLIAGIKAYSDNYLWEYSIERQLRNLQNS